MKDKGLRWAFFRSEVFRSTLVTNLALLLLRSRSPGSGIAVVVEDVRVTVLPDERACHKPRRSFLQRFVS